MAEAVIKINPERTQVQVITPNGDEYEFEYPEGDGTALLEDEEASWFAVFEQQEVLAPGVYRLELVPTVMEGLDAA